MKLEGKTVLITGGTSGIGRELARQLLARGNKVIITGRDADRLEETRRALSGIHVLQSDVSDPDAIVELYRRVIAAHPNLDVLVNNAGIMRNLDLLAARDVYDVTREIEVGFSGPVRMVQQFLSHLGLRPQAAIVNITSGLAFVPMPLSPVYSAAKAALHSFTRSLRSQLAGTGIAVFEVAPPGVETPLFRAEFAEEMKNQKAMSVETLVHQAIAGIESGKAEIRPGAASVLYAMSRLAPNFIFRQLAKFGPRRVPVTGSAARV